MKTLGSALESERSVALLLLSGGLDSAIRLLQLVVTNEQSSMIAPIFLRYGQSAADSELEAARFFVGAVVDARPQTRICQLTVLDWIGGLYPWLAPSGKAVEGGVPCPAVDTPELPVRNGLLVFHVAAYTLYLHRLAGQPAVEFRIITGCRAGEYPDCRDEFLSPLGPLLSQLAAPSTITVAPTSVVPPEEELRELRSWYSRATLHGLLSRTVSCHWPTGRRGCGGCSKCERRKHLLRSIQ